MQIWTVGEDAYRWEKERGDAAVELETEDAKVRKALEWRQESYNFV